jgi:GntR family transcriptional regulator, rspAB operon transcriptional repressor
MGKRSGPARGLAPVSRLVRSDSLAQQARDWLKRELLSGAWSSSDLLTEDELARRLSMSRTPVREALHQLALMGTIEPVVGGGYVRSQATPRLLQEHCELRRLLEPPAARLVAAQRCEVAIDRKALDGRTLDPALNAGFHIAIGEATDSDVLAMLIRTLNERVELHDVYLGAAPARTRLAADHRAIVDALERGDPDGSFTAMADHLDRVQQLLEHRPRAEGERTQRVAVRKPAILPAITKPSLADQAYQELRSAIAGERLTPGTVLVEGELASMLGASRTPIREALRRCEMEGYARRDEDGTLVVARPTARETAQLFFVRELLECYAVHLAASRISDDELDRLDGLVADDQRALRRRQVDQLAHINEQIHSLLIHASRNRTLERLTRTVRARAAAARLFAVGSAAQRNQFVDDHASMAALLRDGDAEAAESVLRGHLRRVEGLLLEGLE